MTNNVGVRLAGAKLCGVVDESAIGERFRALAGELDERQRRLWAGAEARSAGRGGIAATARATGMALDTIGKGIAELESGATPGPGRVRKPGAGRRALTSSDPSLAKDLERSSKPGLVAIPSCVEVDIQERPQAR